MLGLFEVIDGLAALGGYRGSLATAFSLLELVWFLFTLVALLAFQKQSFSLLTPLLYTGYFTLSWFYGSFLIASSPENQVMQLPAWFMWVATLFGASYCTTAFWQYRAFYLARH